MAVASAAVVIAAAACAGTAGNAPPTEPPVDTTGGGDTSDVRAPVLTRTVVMSGLASPWDLAFVNDSTLLYTEKCRGLSIRFANGQTTRLFGTAGSALVADDFFCQGQSGMHGVALHPQFASNRTLFVFMPSTRSTPRTNRVVRVVLNAALTGVVSREDIVTDIALKNASTANGGAGAHSGGRLRFGPDGHLYVTTGDNHDGALPQDPTRLGGKVLRITPAGAAAPGNAAPAGFDARIFTYGHRNVQGIAFRPGTGQPYAAEHGPNHSDEVTPLIAGGNGGWDPQNRPALTCPGGYCGYAGNATSMPMTDRTRFPDALPPLWSNDGASQGMGPAVFLEGTAWRAWNGALAVGIMGGRRLIVLRLTAGGALQQAITTSLPAVRYRALTLAPDGALWIATDDGEVWRVTAS